MKEKHFHILLIEDSVTDAYIIRRVLERNLDHPFKIIHVWSMEEAETILAKSDLAELILLDLHLPDTNCRREGFERLDKIRKDTPIVVLSSVQDYVLADPILTGGMTEFIDKSLIGMEPGLFCDMVGLTILRFRAAQSENLQAGQAV